MTEAVATEEIIDGQTMFGFRPGRGADISLAALLGEMSKHNVKQACTISAVGIFLDFDLGNQQTLAACRESPALIPMATADPRRHVGCMESVDKAAAEGCRVFALFPETQGWSMDSEAACVLAKAVCGAGLAVAIEASCSGGPSRVLRALGDSDARVLLIGVNYLNLGEALQVAKAHPGMHFCTCSLASVGSLEIIAEHAGVERLIFGSGSPANYFSSPYLRVKYGDFTVEQKQAILSGNIRRFLGQVA